MEQDHTDSDGGDLIVVDDVRHEDDDDTDDQADEAMEDEMMEEGVSPTPHPSLPSQCCWCKREGVDPQLINDDHQGFCTERCFSQFRRASFKKNRKCDGCSTPCKVQDMVRDAEFRQFCTVACKSSYKSKKDVTKGDGGSTAQSATAVHSGAPAKKYLTLKSHLLLPTRKPAEPPGKKSQEQLAKVNKKPVTQSKPAVSNSGLNTSLPSPSNNLPGGGNNSNASSSMLANNSLPNNILPTGPLPPKGQAAAQHIMAVAQQLQSGLVPSNPLPMLDMEAMDMCAVLKQVNPMLQQAALLHLLSEQQRSGEGVSPEAAAALAIKLLQPPLPPPILPPPEMVSKLQSGAHNTLPGTSNNSLPNSCKKQFPLRVRRLSSEPAPNNNGFVMKAKKLSNGGTSPSPRYTASDGSKTSPRRHMIKKRRVIGSSKVNSSTTSKETTRSPPPLTPAPGVTHHTTGGSSSSSSSSVNGHVNMQSGGQARWTGPGCLPLMMMSPPPPCTIVGLPFFIPVPIVVPVPVPYKGPPLPIHKTETTGAKTEPPSSLPEQKYEEEINEAINLSKNYNSNHEEAKDLSSKSAKPVAPLSEHSVNKRK